MKINLHISHGMLDASAIPCGGDSTRITGPRVIVEEIRLPPSDADDDAYLRSISVDSAYGHGLISQFIRDDGSIRLQVFEFFRSCRDRLFRENLFMAVSGNRRMGKQLKLIARQVASTRGIPDLVPCPATGCRWISERWRTGTPDDQIPPFCGTCDCNGEIPRDKAILLPR